MIVDLVLTKAAKIKTIKYNYSIRKELKMGSDFYVYVYIDPRNFQEFYYGKGRGNRNLSHLKDEDDNEKTKIIQEINEEGLEPIIRNIAINLSEDEALLVEKTLLWKLGRNLANKSSGFFSKNFRPKNSMHRKLYGFDFENGIFFVNVGEGDHRLWEDCNEFGFLSAGQGTKYSNQIRALNEGDIVAAFITKYGYVGIGRVLSEASPVIEVKNHQNRSLHQLNLRNKKIFENAASEEKTEYAVAIKWIKTVNRDDAKWKKNANLYSGRLIRASLQNQNNTIAFLNREFNVDLHKLLKESETSKFLGE